MPLSDLTTREFFRINFVPRTNIGRFDATCAPVRGTMIIETCLYLNITDDTDAASFKNQFAQLVPQTWNGAYKFRCVKDGFNNLEIRPEFRLSFEDKFQTSHYVVNVSASMYGKEKVSRQDYFKAEGEYKPKVAQLGGMQALQPLDFSGQISQEISQLFPFHVKCPVTSGSISPQAKETLRLLGRQISSLNPNQRIYLAAGGDNKTVNMGKVEQELRDAGCTQFKKDKKLFKYKDEVVVTLKEDLGDGGVNKPLQFSYPATVVHEYGHMLGLTDEYNCLSKTASDKLAELDFVSGSEQHVYENLHAKTANVMVGEFADSQREQIELCRLAGVPPPTFGFKSSSIMAAGRDVHPGHLVTIWQCLVDMTNDCTAAADWKIIKI
jgi:hypothetical protein